MKKPTPQEIYEEALKERAKDDPLKKRQACEKGWLAVTEAVDKFLQEHGKFVRKGTAEAHGDRREFLAQLATTDPNIRRLVELVSNVVENLHGSCFYLGRDNPFYTTVLKEDVKKILQLTGFWNGKDEE